MLYRTAVPMLLDGGINVFDSAPAYRMQSSERTLGSALERVFARGEIQRDEIFVISKGGYLTVDPDSPAAARGGHRYLIETYVDTGLIDPRETVNGIHAMNPRFLLDQVERSRANLRLETIDLYCIEEPELHLHARGPSEFSLLLRECFEALEGAVSSGAIASYGLATWNGLLLPHDERGHLSIVDVFDAALEVGGPDHHLRGIMVPYSVALGEAKGGDTQFVPFGNSTGVFDTLNETGTAVFAIAPLARGRAVRGLPEFLTQSFPECTTDAQCCLQFARSTPTVTTTLVGMREPGHIESNLELLKHPPAEPELIERLFRQARDDRPAT